MNNQSVLDARPEKPLIDRLDHETLVKLSLHPYEMRDDQIAKSLWSNQSPKPKNARKKILIKNEFEEIDVGDWLK